MVDYNKCVILEIKYGNNIFWFFNRQVTQRLYSSMEKAQVAKNHFFEIFGDKYIYTFSLVDRRRDVINRIFLSSIKDEDLPSEEYIYEYYMRYFPTKIDTIDEYIIGHSLIKTKVNEYKSEFPISLRVNIDELKNKMQYMILSHGDNSITLDNKCFIERCYKYQPNYTIDNLINYINETISISKENENENEIMEK